jgi:hypothetical protein
MGGSRGPEGRPRRRARAEGSVGLRHLPVRVELLRPVVGERDERRLPAVDARPFRREPSPGGTPSQRKPHSRRRRSPDAPKLRGPGSRRPRPRAAARGPGRRSRRSAPTRPGRGGRWGRRRPSRGARCRPVHLGARLAASHGEQDERGPDEPSGRRSTHGRSSSRAASSRSRAASSAAARASPLGSRGRLAAPLAHGERGVGAPAPGRRPPRLTRKGTAASSGVRGPAQSRCPARASSRAQISFFVSPSSPQRWMSWRQAAAWGLPQERDGGGRTEGAIDRGQDLAGAPRAVLLRLCPGGRGAHGRGEDQGPGERGAPIPRHQAKPRARRPGGPAHRSGRRRGGPRSGCTGAARGRARGGVSGEIGPASGAPGGRLAPAHRADRRARGVAGSGVFLRAQAAARSIGAATARREVP